MTREAGSFRKCLAKKMVREGDQGGEEAYEQWGRM